MNELFGEFVKQLRKTKGITQKELAELLHVSDKAVSKWEVGDSYPDISLLIPLSEVFEITTDELLHCQLVPSEKAEKSKILVFNIAANLVLIVVILIYLTLMFLPNSEGQSVAFTITNIEDYTFNILLILIGLIALINSFNIFYFKKMRRDEIEENVIC